MGLFRRILFGSKSQELQHPVFGKLRLIKAKNGSYWEGEPVVEGESIGLAVETTDGDAPTESQVLFFQRSISNMDGTFALAAPLLIPEYEKWMRGKFPDQWRAAFKLAGISLPLEGVADNPWDISYDCLTDKAGHQFTCYFEEGQPVHVSIDG